MNRLAEIEARLSEINAEISGENSDKADLTALGAEADKLIGERKALIEAQNSRSALLAKIAEGNIGVPAKSKNGIDIGSGTPDLMEQRAAEFARSNTMLIPSAESRSILVSGGTIARPTKVSGINHMPGTPCSIVDMVTVEDCSGMASDTVAYVATESAATDGTEGNAATTSEGTFGQVTISPTLKNLISYISKEIKNQSPLNYTAKVQSQAFKALRRAAGKIVSDAITSSTIANEITSITAIDAKTLRTIVFNHGSDETIEGNAVLFLNKADLIAFGDVRGTNEKKAVYEITPDGANPNVGVIKDGGLSVRYCINPNCTALTGSTNSSTTKTKPTMFYGNPACAKLDLFGTYTVETSNDYKFAEGLIAVLGSMSVGAGMVVKNGFTLVSIDKASG